jgi:acetyl-CoA acetyltransferase
MQDTAAIVGAGLTEVGKVYGRSARSFAADAVRRAVADAGLELAEVDGLLVSAGKSGGLDLSLARHLGLQNLRLLSEIDALGASAGIMVAQAAAAVRSGAAEVVACVFADAPRQPGQSSGEAYRQSSLQAGGVRSAETAAGFTSVTHRYALAASRYMHHYGITSDELAAVAVGQRAWATANPAAQQREPLSLADYHRSRWIVEPLHLLDCCLVSNGGAAVVVTTPQRAAHLAQPPVRVLGWGQAHPGYALERGTAFGLVTGAEPSGAAALAMAGLSPAEIDIREIYDCYTYVVLVSLEDYGFCGKGEAGALAAGGALAPGGSLPTNTGGGQLSGFYLWGMTPLLEAVTQLRGQAGARQVPRHGTALVSGNGGVLDHHATLVLGADT